MQNNEVDILGALTCLLKTLKETGTFASKSLTQWITYAATVEKCTEKDGHTVYQCQQLQRYFEAQTYYTYKYEEYCCSVSYCINSRLSWSDLQAMRDIIFLLSSHGWEKLVEEENDMAAIDRLVKRFASPLEVAQANTDAIKTEFCDVIAYTVQYISLSSLDYHSVWWRLFHAPNSDEWANLLIFAELLFSLPASNGKLERVFSLLGTIKVDKRSCLTSESLDDLLLLKSSSTPLASFSTDASIDLWWSAKARRPSQKGRKEYRSRSLPSTSQVQDDSDEEGEAAGILG